MQRVCRYFVLVLLILLINIELVHVLRLQAFPAKSTPPEERKTTSPEGTITASTTASKGTGISPIPVRATDASAISYVPPPTAPSPWEALMNVKSIKTPQLIGILAGCFVFVTTISVVIVLLVQSGTLSRFRDEMMMGGPVSISGKRMDTAPQFSALPELYDHLLDATMTLPLQPRIDQLIGKKITIRPLNTLSDKDVQGVLGVSNGSAIFGESAYDPARIWGWIRLPSYHLLSSTSNKHSSGNNGKSNNGKNSNNNWPASSLESFRRSFSNDVINGLHMIIFDNILQKPVGMLSLADNRPHDLNIRIDNVWITPAYQSKRYAHEALYLLMAKLFDSNYRRVTVEVDNRHLIMRKFLERCGFRLEATLRKHRIVDARNSDTAVYVVLNSEWEEVQLKLKKYLGLPLQEIRHKIAEIETGSIAVPSLMRQSSSSSNHGGKGGVKNNPQPWESTGISEGVASMFPLAGESNSISVNHNTGNGNTKKKKKKDKSLSLGSTILSKLDEHRPLIK